jgi:hypothetical protein
MKKHVGSIAVALVLGSVSTAAAMPSLVILEYGKKLQSLKQDPHMDEATFANCRKDIQQAQSEMKPDENVRALYGELDGMAKARKLDGEGDYLFLASKDAMAICDRLEKYAPWAKAMEPIDKTGKDAWWLEKILDSGIPDSALEDSWAKGYVEEEQGCRTAAAAMAKAPYKTIAVEQNGNVEVGALEKTVCDAMKAQLDRLAKAKEEAIAANKKWWEETAAPYRKAGMAGERLDYFVGADTIAIYGKGGKELTTPKQKAAAKVTFEVLTGDDGSVTIKRFAWKGNKAAGWSQKDYPLRPGPGAFR